VSGVEAFRVISRVGGAAFGWSAGRDCPAEGRQQIDKGVDPMRMTESGERRRSRAAPAVAGLAAGLFLLGTACTVVAPPFGEHAGGRSADA
jgi:hypothetical protein